MSMEVHTMKYLSTLPLLAVSAPALAHPGHVAEQAGHSHWLAVGLVLAAAGVATFAIGRAVLRRRRRIANA